MNLIGLTTDLTLTLTTEQIQLLLNFYKSFRNIFPELNIHLRPTHCIISNAKDDVTLITLYTIRNLNERFEENIQNVINRGIDFNVNIFLIEDYIELLKMVPNSLQPQGQQIYTFSKVFDAIKKKIAGETSLVIIQGEISQRLNHNGQRTYNIAHRCNKFMIIIGEFPIPKFDSLSPSWLLQIFKANFNYFLQRC